LVSGFVVSTDLIVTCRNGAVHPAIAGKIHDRGPRGPRSGIAGKVHDRGSLGRRNFSMEETWTSKPPA
jgi:hypothetical protein